MQPKLLLPADEYASDFEIAWRAYSYTRGKHDAFKAWAQMSSQRPAGPLLLLCIEEYRCELRKTKLSQAYFASWLRGRRWLDHIEDARYRLNNPLPASPVRSYFKASDYPDVPLEHRPKLTAAQIIAARGNRTALRDE